MPDFDMKAIRKQHGLAQAKAETEMKRDVGNRFATVSLEQGHRRGFWEGVEFALTHLAGVAGERPQATRKASDYGVHHIEGPKLVTVAEWAEAHCREDHEVTEHEVQQHVAAVVLALIKRNRSPWDVGVDADGRVSLLWASLPPYVWEILYAEGSSIVVLRGHA